MTASNLSMALWLSAAYLWGFAVGAAVVAVLW